MLNMPSVDRILVATQNPDKLSELQACLEEVQQQVADQLNVNIELLLPGNYGDIEEAGESFLENAHQKAQGFTAKAQDQIHALKADWVLAEDSGLVIPALSGQCGLNPFPGVRSKRWLTPALRDELLGLPEALCEQAEVMSGKPTQDERNKALWTLMRSLSRPEERHAQYQCGMVLYSVQNGFCLEALGMMDLQVIQAWSPRGSGGFGYDPIMQPIVGNTVWPQTVAELDIKTKNRLSHRGQAFRDILSQINQCRQAASG